MVTPTGASGPDEPDPTAGDPDGADLAAGQAAGEAAAEERPPAAAPPPDFHELHDTGEGDLLLRLDVWATLVFAVVAGLAAGFPDAFVPVFVPVSLVMFALGCVAFIWAFARGVNRSRYEAVTMGGLFFLTGGVAPARVRRVLRALFAVQVVVAVAAAVARPFTPLAFGTLAPVLGLGLIAVWAARYGEFPPKDDEA